MKVFFSLLLMCMLAGCGIIHGSGHAENGGAGATVYTGIKF